MADTVAQIISRYRDAVEKHRNWGRSKRYCLNRLQKELGEIPPNDLTKTRLIEWAERRREAGAGPSTVSMDLSYLRSAVKFSHGRWDTPYDPTAFEVAQHVLSQVRLIGQSNTRTRRPTPGEISAILAAADKRCRKLPMADIVAFAIETTMRLSEITGITWADYNELAGTLLIRKRKHPTQKALNDQTVPILPAAAAIIARQPRCAARIFPFNSRSISNMFIRIRDECGIRDLHFHDFRREAVSRLFERGYTPAQVMLFTGHSNLAMLSRYMKLDPARTAQAARLEKAGEVTYIRQDMTWGL